MCSVKALTMVLSVYLNVQCCVSHVRLNVALPAGTYKIPTANDIPIDFRVTLLKDAPNQRTPHVYSSKAVGEPPFFLGASVFFALKEAVYAARADAGHKGWFQMDAPATPERLRMACADQFTASFASADLHIKTSC